MSTARGTPEEGAADAGPPPVGALIAELRAGDTSATGRLFPLVYEELKRIARLQRRSWSGEAETLNTTALVHEAYVKLARGRPHDWRDRAHFLAVAATAMRSILVDHARERCREKRGHGRAPLALDAIDAQLAAPAASAEDADMLMALDAALDRLSACSDRQGKIVECRFFGGMSVEETAEALGISSATVKRGWAVARVWLYRELSAEAGP